MAVYDLEEQEKIATLKSWWDQYGNYVTGALTIVCVIIIAVQGWRWYTRSQAEKAAVLYGAALRLPLLAKALVALLALTVVGLAWAVRGTVRRLRRGSPTRSGNT